VIEALDLSKRYGNKLARAKRRGCQSGVSLVGGLLDVAVVILLLQKSSNTYFRTSTLTVRGLSGTGVELDRVVLARTV
jgi:hypothetical protein